MTKIAEPKSKLSKSFKKIVEIKSENNSDNVISEKSNDDGGESTMRAKRITKVFDNFAATAKMITISERRESEEYKFQKESPKAYENMNN